MHSTRIDIPSKTRHSIVKLLNARLADAIDLSMQAKQAHWNVKGPNFIALHELFDQIAEHVDTHVDELAERITILGGTAQGTLKAVAINTNLKPWPEKIVSGRQHVEALANALAQFAKATRAAIKESDDLSDEVTADLFNEITAKTDKNLWFVEAHLQADE
jgi:starvation-inducible DNA-binding protein